MVIGQSGQQSVSAAMGKARITIAFNSLSPGLKQFPGRLDRGIAAVMNRNAPKVERYMRQNAPWTDRTTNARNGLKATATKDDRYIHVIDLMHTMPYGIWLEVLQNGKFAIIQPTVRVMGPMVVKDFNKLLERF